MTRRAGFTLIELVVVIMILGILAGIAAPKMFNTSNTAKDNGLKQTLSIVRDAIELYNARYGSLPPCTSTGSDFRSALTPEFIRVFPASPVGLMNNLVKPVTTTSADGTVTGWMYNTATGEFICNSSAASASGPTYNTF